MKVSKKWLQENCETIWGFGGQFTKDDLSEVKVPKGGFETTLTRKGVEAVEYGQRVDKFSVLIPNGIGWANCVPFNQGW